MKFSDEQKKLVDIPEGDLFMHEGKYYIKCSEAEVLVTDEENVSVVMEGTTGILYIFDDSLNVVHYPHAVMSVNDPYSNRSGICG